MLRQVASDLGGYAEFWEDCPDCNPGGTGNRDAQDPKEVLAVCEDCNDPWYCRDKQKCMFRQDAEIAAVSGAEAVGVEVWKAARATLPPDPDLNAPWSRCIAIMDEAVEQASQARDMDQEIDAIVADVKANYGWDGGMGDPPDDGTIRAIVRGALGYLKDHDGWRPIETAPKDGTRIIVGRQSGYVMVWASSAYWFERNYKGHKSHGWTDGFDTLALPTHWQPLRAPPEQAKGESQKEVMPDRHVSPQSPDKT